MLQIKTLTIQNPETLVGSTAIYRRNPVRLPSHWRIFMTGITSIHGWPLFQHLEKMHPSENLFGLRPPKMTMPQRPNVIAGCTADAICLKKIRDQFKPTHIIHCGGVCDLDVCEERPLWAARINHGGAQLQTDIFGDSASILYASSDLVFSGNTPPATGYSEKCEANPVSVAGRTYALAESAIREAPRHCIVRLGLPIGRSISFDKGGLDWIEGRFSKKRRVSLFHDELRSCIPTGEIAAVMLSLISNQAHGLFHLGGKECISLHELGRRILVAGGYSHDLLTSWSRHDDITGPPRIGNVGLDSSKLMHWLEGIPQNQCH